MPQQEMKSRIALLIASALMVGMLISSFTYPPGVGVTTNSRSCMSCHVENGPWDDDGTIIDMVDKATMSSLRQPDGTFVLKVKRGERSTVLTVIGRKAGDTAARPYRNGWTYIDPTRIGTGSISKFAPGWSVDLQMSCRLVGDQLPAFEGTSISALPMTVMPLDDAKDSEIELQLMLTSGEAVKGNAALGITGNYFVRTVKLDVLDQ